MTESEIIEGYKAKRLPRRRVGFTLTPPLLRELLCYDPVSGRLTWKPRPLSMFDDESAFCDWNRKHAGSAAFTSIGKNGYRSGTILGKYCVAHRIAWCLHYGTWPESSITFANADRADIRISNLKAKGSSAR